MIKAYLDSCIIISLIEGTAIQRQLIRRSLLGRSVFSSKLARLETRITPIRRKNQSSLQQLDRFFAICKMPEFDRTVFNRAVQLRVESKPKTPDALHLAAAIVPGCQEFWTEGKQLKPIASQYLKVADWAAMEKR